MSQKENGKTAGPPKWMIIVVVVLMLLGMAVYLLSLDEAIQPEPVTSPIPVPTNVPAPEN